MMQEYVPNAHRLRRAIRRLASPLIFALALLFATAESNAAQQQTSATGTGGGVLFGSAAAIKQGEAQADKILAGDAIGTVVGGAGFYIDELEQWLGQVPGATVERVSDHVVLMRFPTDFLFRKRSRWSSSEGQSALQQVGALLVDFKKTAVVVQAHTSPGADEAESLRLSQRQAKSVKTHLIGRGVKKTRIDAVGYGGKYPVASDAPAQVSNWRVDILFKAKSQ